MASVCAIFGPFCFYCNLVFYILGAFLIKQLFHSHLLDIDDYSQLKATRLVGYLSSHPTRAHRIIVKYVFNMSGMSIML